MTGHEGIDVTLEEMADWLKAIAHPVRLCIVRNLSHRDNANVSCMQDCLGVSQSSVSQHLAKLKAHGIVTSKRDGKEIYYQICDERIKRLIAVMFDNIE
jgi:ArsR family transcriptional regulator